MTYSLQGCPLWCENQWRYFKEEGGSSGVYDVRPVTDLDVRIKESDLPLHKPPGLIQRCHVNGPDQRHVAPTSVSYGATRPLSHFTDPGVGRTASLSPQSSPYFQGQSPRVIQQYSSPVPRSPSAPSLQLSQSQQLRFSPGSQQLQVSQGQQLHITQDPKSASSTHNSQQQSTTYGNYPSSTLHSSGPFQMNLSQSQSVTLNTHYPPGGNSHSNINRLAVNHQQMTPQGAMSTPIHPQQSRVSQFPMRPSPHYKPHRIVSQPQHSPQIVMGNGSMMRYEHNMTPNFNHPDPTVTPTVGATAFHQLQNSSFLTQESQHPQIVGHRNASHSDPRFPQSVHQPNMPSSNNITHNQPSYNSALSRPPNVNAGPDGVNISHQQLPGTGVQWRNSFPQQEQSQLQVGVIGQSAAPWFPQQSPHMTPNIRPVAMDSVQKTVMSPHVQNLNTMMHHHQQGTRRMTPMDERNEVSVSGGDVISQSEPFRRKGHPQTGVMEEQPQFHLDFLDNIESSATDLLSFDQVMSTGNTNFDILEDMGIMGK
ncbi:uncharacterized protein LOC143228480 [Tachypleus tridentatus]|uniref:uncharacterized protein LOC143228480 n=1 Tax=Tachypleus tridentatus TaxID=6853 RepID=UPI003FD10907